MSGYMTDIDVWLHDGYRWFHKGNFGLVEACRMMISATRRKEASKVDMSRCVEWDERGMQ
jgi:hypothetical protein